MSIVQYQIYFYHSDKTVVSDLKFLSLHLLLLSTCIFTYAQMVSYFSLLHNFYHSDKSVVSDMKFVFLSPFATSVNLCIHLCSGGKLLFITS